MPIPSAALAISNAFANADRASARLIESVSHGDGDAAAAVADLTTAKVQVKASVAVVRIADEMWRALIEPMVKTDK